MNENDGVVNKEKPLLRDKRVISNISLLYKITLDAAAAA